MRTLLAIPLILLVAPATAEVYKCVDENGTVVFTDQKCSDDAQPMELPGLTIMDAPKPKPATTGSGGTEEGRAGEVFRDLTLLSPRPEQTFQGTGNTLPVRAASREPLREGDQVVVFLDGQQQGPFGSLSVDLTDVPRGTHDVRLEVRDAQGRVIGDAGPVTFYMKQHSRLHQNQPLVNPPPGGGS